MINNKDGVFLWVLTDIYILFLASSDFSVPVFCLCIQAGAVGSFTLSYCFCTYFCMDIQVFAIEED